MASKQAQAADDAAATQPAPPAADESLIAFPEGSKIDPGVDANEPDRTRIDNLAPGTRAFWALPGQEAEMQQKGYIPIPIERLEPGGVNHPMVVRGHVPWMTPQERFDRRRAAELARMKGVDEVVPRTLMEARDPVTGSSVVVVGEGHGQTKRVN